MKTIDLNDKDYHTLLLLIRARQDDCRHITSEHPTYSKYQELFYKLEGFKGRILRQNEACIKVI
jgi:hypothetical protein